MITNRILVLKKAAKLPNGLEFKTATEFHIVRDVVYMQGHPLPMGLQAMIINWTQDNSGLFREITR